MIESPLPPDMAGVGQIRGTPLVSFLVSDSNIDTPTISANSISIIVYSHNITTKGWEAPLMALHSISSHGSFPGR